METAHRIYFKNSSDMHELDSDSIDLMITSPPYPMIEMWDLLFSNLNSEIKHALEKSDSKRAFNLMHKELENVWIEVIRVLKEGGIACVNIGDATRKIGNNFQLFPNHIKIVNFFQKNDFFELPCILWRKPINSPNKFMGSGMIPPNAYVTLEHEYILIFRKGVLKRKFSPNCDRRYQSAFFWEERNKWFSDLWDDIKGVTQNMNKMNLNQNKLRERSAAYPLEIPYRLINMFSLHEDIVVDPFWGTGTTTLAAMISARNSIGYEINKKFLNIFKEKMHGIKTLNNDINENRLKQHIEFIKRYENEVKEIKYKAIHYNLPVITKQEKGILLFSIKNYNENSNKFLLKHEKFDISKLKNL